ncbi:MAG: hypothetical protein RR561_05400 [Peptostreptococcus sp.]|uniref:hypothetical protein n=1 Tax=Peptostreptococcus sp. TaxID=1262 RepID=UPI002FC76D50
MNDKKQSQVDSIKKSNRNGCLIGCLIAFISLAAIVFLIMAIFLSMYDEHSSKSSNISDKSPYQYTNKIDGFHYV